MINDVNYITEVDLKDNTSISKNVDTNLLVPYIRSAEAMYVIDILGVALNTELKNQITGGTLSEVNKSLIDFYIKPASSWATFLSAVPFIAFKTTSKGVLRQNSDNSEVPPIQDLNWFKQAIKDNMSFYRNELLNYLENNKDKYPNYRPNNNSNSKKTYSNGIYLGKY
jgi:hypothetical protein